jgi:NACalpha-BTF3-like transcription factor
MVDDISEKKYNAFMINRGLSYFFDTAVLANEMNRNSFLDNRLQYDFLRQIVRKKKRFSKWLKSESVENIEIVMEYYGYSREKATQALKILKNQEIEYIRNKLKKGGRR